MGKNRWAGCDDASLEARAAMWKGEAAVARRAEDRLRRLGRHDEAAAVGWDAAECEALCREVRQVLAQRRDAGQWPPVVLTLEEALFG